MRLVGAIVAGGGAKRMGGDKPFTPFAGGILLDAVIGRVMPQVDALALNLRRDDAKRARHLHQFPLLHDAAPDAGPLAGIVTALEWARGLGDADWLASFPGDTPFLPTNLVVQLAARTVPGKAAFAHDGERAQYLCALWPLACLEALRDGLTAGRLRSLTRAHEELGSIRSDVAAASHAFFNVNTPDDLKEAERLAAL